jgi:plasmid stabilization system protein ParE
VDFLIDQDKAVALATYGILEEGLSLLKNHPEIGRPTEADGIRELIISRGRSGYVALYAFDELNDSIVILRVKHQRETAFDSPT